MRSKRFLEEYCWVVYASGFSADILESKFDALKIAYKDFDINKLYKIRSINNILSTVNNKIKANCFLKGCKIIHDTGFSKFKKEIIASGIDKFEDLPGIGPITKFHLAKNIGFMDAAKPDRWLERIAQKCSATVDELVSFLSKNSALSHHTVDIILGATL